MKTQLKFILSFVKLVAQLTALLVSYQAVKKR